MHCMTDKLRVIFGSDDISDDTERIRLILVYDSIRFWNPILAGRRDAARIAQCSIINSRVIAIGVILFAGPAFVQLWQPSLDRKYSL